MEIWRSTQRVDQVLVGGSVEAGESRKIVTPQAEEYVFAADGKLDEVEDRLVLAERVTSADDERLSRLRDAIERPGRGEAILGPGHWKLVLSLDDAACYANRGDSIEQEISIGHYAPDEYSVRVLTRPRDEGDELAWHQLSFTLDAESGQPAPQSVRESLAFRTADGWMVVDGKVARPGSGIDVI